MDDLVLVAMFGLAALVIAWVVNGMVGWLSGERPKDTGRLWADIFLRFFTILELGWIGRLLTRMGLNGWPGKFVAIVGMICVLLFLLRSCEREEPSYRREYNTPVQTE